MSNCFLHVPQAIGHSLFVSQNREATMKRMALMLSVLVLPFFAAHLLFAAGFFKVGEKAPSFTLNAITG